MVRIILVIISAIVLYISGAFAEPMKTIIFDRNFKTLKVSNPDNFMSAPVLRLGTDDRLVVSYDLIEETANDDLQYRLVHCNADWEPSSILESEYVDGFNIADIEDYAYSSNTFIHYVNYRIELPDERMPIILSGNYVLQVFDRNKPEDVLLQARFQVSESQVPIEAAYTSRTDRGFNSEWQQLAVTVDVGNAGVKNPYSDLIVKINQNGRDETSRTLQTPMRVESGKAAYAHAPELIFPASNEYRRFETISTTFPAMRVDSMRHAGVGYHAWVNTDYARAERGYEYDRTQHGRFLVREYNASDSDLGADYITVHFTLDMPYMSGYEIYVDGEMTHGAFDETNRMQYNRQQGVYELQLPLKQGSYNYQYVAKKAEKPEFTTAPIEGNKYETDNEYRVSVYYRPPGARYDRLLGVCVIER